MTGFDKKWEYTGVRVKEAENYVLSLLLHVNLWAILCNCQASHKARHGPVLGGNPAVGIVRATHLIFCTRSGPGGWLIPALSLVNQGDWW